MKYTGKRWIAPRYFFLAFATLSIFIIVSIILQFYISRSAVLNVMDKEGVALIQSLNLSGQNAVLSTEALQNELEERLFNCARLIDELDNTGMLNLEVIQRISKENNYSVNIFDNYLKKILSTQPNDTNDIYYRKFITEIFNDSIYQYVINPETTNYIFGKNFFVAIKRKKGGTIITSVDSEYLLDFRKRIGVGKLLQDIGQMEGIIYIALQDEDGIISASKNITSLKKIAGDTFLEDALYDNQLKSRIISFENKKVFEIVSPFYIDDESVGLMRLGLSMNKIEMINRQLFLQLLIIVIILLVMGGLVITAVMKDWNELKRIEDELAKSERLSAIGTLSASVAHEIRNPLNAISLTVQRLSKEFTPTEDKEEYVRFTNIVSSEINRLNQIVEQFLTFARPLKLELKKENIHNVIDNVVSILSSEISSKGISLEKNYQNVHEINLDKDKIHQAIFNLILNSIQSIEAKNTNSEKKIRIHTFIKNKYVVIKISDTGCGISPENINRIFDPYFTTKDKGTGIGLSIVYRIISDHNGKIEVESKENEGTTFLIYLPL